MKTLREFRAKAALCRQLAVREPANRDLWFAEAEKWRREEQEEIFGTRSLGAFERLAPVTCARRAVSD
jgi:hypothetical protein